MYVILLDNGQQYAGEYQIKESLYSYAAEPAEHALYIKYRGHSYGTTYSGPIVR
jgi:hypothetical protein